MSSKHLGNGSEEPPRVPGLLRLYSMGYCPWAHRPRLVLKAKGIPHDIVNINLGDKPEWYLKIHPEGKVPALLDGDKVIVESLDICEYLDEKYPENPLYPTDPEKKAKDKEFVGKFGSLLGVYSKCLYRSEDKTPEELWSELLEVLKPFDDELAKRGSTFFGGDKPGMIDYLLWPFGERSDLICLKLGAPLPIKSDEITLMQKWKKAMLEDSVCKELYNGPAVFWRLMQIRKRGETVDYDNF